MLSITALILLLSSFQGRRNEWQLDFAGEEDDSRGEGWHRHICTHQRPCLSGYHGARAPPPRPKKKKGNPRWKSLWSPGTITRTFAVHSNITMQWMESVRWSLQPPLANHSLIPTYRHQHPDNHFIFSLHSLVCLLPPVIRSRIIQQSQEILLWFLHFFIISIIVAHSFY